MDCYLNRIPDLAICVSPRTHRTDNRKKKLNIKLVRDNTGQPVGAGMAFVRLFLAGLFGSFLFGIYTLLDYLWPLWDPEKKRLTDKMITMSVVTV